MNFSRWLAEYRVHHLLSLVALRPDSDITALAPNQASPPEPPSSGSSGKSPDLRPTNTETYEKRPANNLLSTCLAFDAGALRPLVYQIVRIKFQYVRIFSHPLIYQMGLSIFDLASPLMRVT